MRHSDNKMILFVIEITCKMKKKRKGKKRKGK